MLLNNLFSNGLGGGTVNERVFDFTATEAQTEFPVPHGGYSVNVSANGVNLHGPDLNLSDLTKVILITPRSAGDLIRITLLGGQVSGNSGGGIEVGQLVSGFFAGNPKYVPANGSRYLLSAYPDMAALVAAGSIVSVTEPTQVNPIIISGKMDAGTYKEQYIYADDAVIMVPQQHSSSVTNGYLLAISQDFGETWEGRFPKAAMNTVLGMPEIGSNGLSQSWIVSICKLDQPGAYGALLASSTTSGSLYYVYTLDYGVTWRGYTMLSAGITMTNNKHSLMFKNGALLWVGPSIARYSVNGGSIWTNLTDSSFANSNFMYTFTLSSDGYLVFTNSTTSLLYLQWPATIAGWNANIAFTSINKLPAARTYIKKCGDYWCAFSANTGVIYYSTTLLGTYLTKALTGLSGIRDIEYVNGNFYFIGNNASMGWDIYTTPTMEGTANPVLITQSAYPSFSNSVGSRRWPLISTVFQINLSAPSRVYYKHGRESIAATSAPGLGGTTQIFGVTPTIFPQYCRKYNMWFCSTGLAESFPASVVVASLDNSATVLHYRSVDGKNWVGVGTGRGGIVDAGDRLLRMNADWLLEQSTDGITWNTDGITRPTTGSTAAGRLWRCKNAVYYFTTSSAISTSSAYLYVSLNGGGTWTTVSGLAAFGMVASIKGCMAYYNGKYYCIQAYANGNPASIDRTSADTFQILESADGITFSPVYSTTGAAGQFQPHLAGFVLAAATMYCFSGFINGTTQSISLVTGDGRNYVTAAGSPIAASLSGSSTILWDFDCSNGDQRSIRPKTIGLGGSNLSGGDVYRENILEATILFAGNSSSTQVSSIGGSGGHLMGSTQWATFEYSAESLAFLVPIPNSGTSPMPFPFMRVAN